MLILMKKRDNTIKMRSNMPIYDPNIAVPIISFGMLFDDAKSFKDALVIYAFSKRRDFRYLQNTDYEERAKCKDLKCKHMIYKSYENNTLYLHIFLIILV